MMEKLTVEDVESRLRDALDDVTLSAGKKLRGTREYEYLHGIKQGYEYALDLLSQIGE
jgi:hypothetical protein